MIYVTGDTHGEQNRFIASREEKHWTAEDVLIVCGDFGFLFFNDRSENLFLDDLERRPYSVCFLDGNHENFPAIFSYPEEEWCGGRVHRIRRNIFHLMRGQVYEIQGRLIFTMGGAYSMDRWRRELGVSYWEELPCDAEYKEAVQNLARHHNQVDYILTHTAPREIIRMMGSAPDAHDMELTGFLEYIRHEVTFRHWYFGHWHDDRDITNKDTLLWFDVRRL